MSGMSEGCMVLVQMGVTNEFYGYKCGGTTATEVDPESVELTGAYTQVVAGIRVRAEFKVNVTGCTVQYRASINASTITDLDGGLSLESFNSDMNASSAKMFAIGFWALLLFSTFIAFISTN